MIVFIYINDKIFKGILNRTTVSLNDVDDIDLNSKLGQSKKDELMFSEDVPYLTKNSYGFLKKSKVYTNTKNKTISIHFYRKTQFKYDDRKMYFTKEHDNLLTSFGVIDKFNL